MFNFAAQDCPAVSKSYPKQWREHEVLPSGPGAARRVKVRTQALLAAAPATVASKRASGGRRSHKSAHAAAAAFAAIVHATKQTAIADDNPLGCCGCKAVS